MRQRYFAGLWYTAPAHERYIPDSVKVEREAQSEYTYYTNAYHYLLMREKSVFIYSVTIYDIRLNK